MIKFTNVTKRYSGFIALDDINFELPNTGLVVIEGENGSGKSTVMNLIGGLDKPILGTIEIDGKTITDMEEAELCTYREENISFIFQDGNLFENMTVEENIKIVGGNRNYDEIVDSLNIRHLLSKKAKELSGGEKSRVGLARALLKDSKIILADEPTAAIDSDSKDAIFTILQNMSKTRLVIVVTHDKEMMNTYADLIITLQAGKVVNVKKKLLADFPNTSKPHKNVFDFVNFTKKNLYIDKKKIARNSIMLLLSFFFILISSSLSSIDIDKMHSETMKMENEDTLYFTISKKENGYYTDTFKSSDVDSLSSILNRKTIPKKKIEIDDRYISLDIKYPDKFKEDRNRYFASDMKGTNFLSIDDCREITYGSKPKTMNEIVINSYLAEAIVEFGVTDIDENVYKPSSLDELIRDKRELKLYDLPVIVTGISKLNDDQFEPMKTNEDNFLSAKMTDYIDLKGDDIYVLDSFFEYFKEYRASIDSHISIVAKPYVDGFSETGRDLGFEVFSKPILMKQSLELLDHLEEDEILINGLVVSELRLSPNDTIGKEVTLYFLDSSKQVREKKNFKIVGISADDTNYMSKQALEDYIDDHIKIKTVEVYEEDSKEIEKLLNKYRKEDDNFDMETVYSTKYGEIEENAQIFSYMAGILGIIFILLGALFSFNYILNSEEEHKKDIAILKSLGIKNERILMSFALEITSLSIKAYLFGVITFLIVRLLINYVTSTVLAIKVNILPISLPIITIIIVVLLIFDIGISILSFYKIKRTTPQELFKINSI